MRLGGKRNRVMFCSVLIIFMFTVFSPNVQFQISTVHAGDWETVEYIDSIDDLNVGMPIEVEGKLVHQGFVPAASETNYVDARQSQTYGTSITLPPGGMGHDGATHTTLTEGSYVSTSYTTKTSYTGGPLPGGWGNTDWSFGASYVNIVGFDKTGGNFYTNTHDMTSYAGVRVKFDWRNDGSRTTELGDLECNSYEGGNNVWFESPVGNQGSFTNELRDSSWHSTAWKVKFTASGLDGDIDTWEGFRVDNIYLQGKVSNTYYRFEAVYRFDSVTYNYGTERLYVDYDSGTSQEGLTYYGGITTDPTDLIGDTSGAEPDTNFDIHDELTGTPFYVKIIDTARNDGDQDSWLIDRLYITVTSVAPVVETDPVCITIDDGDNLYARRSGSYPYHFSVNVSDAEGYNDIDYVLLRSYDYDTTTLRWGVKYDGGVWSEEATGSSYIELDTVNSQSGLSGNNMNLTFFLAFTFEISTWVDDDLYCYVVDKSSLSADRSVDSNYDYDYRLDWYGGPEVSSDDAGTVNHGDLDETFIIGGTLKYYGSDSHVKPAGNRVDVWVSASEYGSNEGPWSDLYTPDGVVSVTCYADDAVGQDTYTVKPVKNNAGSTGASLYYDAGNGDETTTYIADQVWVANYGTDDNRININSQSGVYLALLYTHNFAYFTTGTVTVNGDSATYSGFFGGWTLYKTKTSVQGITYDTVVTSGDDTHGLTGVNQDGESILQIWDEIEVVSYTIVSPSGDNRNNIGTTYTIDVDLRYKYDLLDVLDGTVTVNGLSTGYQGSGKWRFTDTWPSVNDTTYNNVQCTSNQHGITAEDNTVTQQVIWDRIYAVSLSYGGDTRINAGTSVNFDYELHYDFDEADVVDGTIFINGFEFVYQSGGIWRYTTSNSGAVGDITFDSIVAASNTHGITSTTTDGNDVTLIWDRIKVMSYTIVNPAGDNRNNIGTTYTIDIELHYDYDETDVADGTITVNGESMDSYQGSGKWRWTPYQAGVTGITYNNMQATGNTHGITSEDNTVTQLIIWDQVYVVSLSYGGDTRVNVGTSINFDWELHYDYDEANVTDGTVTINGYGCAHQGSGVWRYTTNNGGSVGDLTLDNIAVTGNTHGITSDNQNGKTVVMIWDRVQIQSYTVTDDWVNINDNVNIDFLVWYDYDDTQVTDGDFTLNGYDAAHLGSGVWRITRTSASPVLVTYNTVLVSSANTHGIDVEDQNGKSRQVVWDSVTIAITGPTDNRQNINANASGIHITITMDYNATAYGGSATMNNTDYNGDGTVVRWGYTVSSVSGGTYGITTISSNDVTYMIWDRIQIQSYSVSDARDDVNDNVDIDATLWYDYDDALVTDGTVTINGYSASYQGSGVWRITRTSVTVTAVTYNNVQATGNTHGITTEDQNGKSQQVIWDRVIWYTYTRNATVAGGRMTNCTSVNIGETVNITARFLFEYDLSVINTQIYLEGEAMTYITDGYWYLEVSNATASFGGHYQFNSFTNPSNTYDITVMNTNSKDFYIIWDSIYIDAYGVEPDARHNAGEYPTLWVTAKLTYDDDVLDTTSDYIKLAGQTFQWNGSYLVNNTFTLDQVGQFTLSTNSSGHNEATYGITEIEFYSFTTIFDRVLVYAMWSPTEADNRTNYGDTETVYVSFVSEYDNSSMTAGTFELNSTGMSYVSGSNWQKTGYSYSAVVNYTFNVNSASWSAYGINQINYNGWNVTYYHIVWDRVKILTTATDDGRITYDTNATLSVTAELEYDSHSLGSGDALYLNNTAMSWNGSHFVLLDQKFASVGVWSYCVNDSGINEATYGITSLNLNGQSVNQIWDRVYLTGIYVSDSRASYGADVNVTVTAKAEYDNGVLGSGDSIYINGTLATWDSTHSVFNVTYSYSEVVNKTFHVTAVNEATYDITALTNDTHVWIIWDRLKITGFLVDDVIPDPLQMIFINLTMVYEFDDVEFHFDNGSINMIAYNVTWDVEETKGMHWNDTNWQFNHTMPSGVGVVRNFNISAFTDSVYGIAVINWNGYDNVTAGSDRVLVISYVVSDDRDDINDYIWVNVTLHLESNSTAIVDGDVVVNGYIFAHIGSGIWQYNTTQASVTSIAFNNVVAENNTYGIETVNQNGQYTTIIWDRIVITNFWVIDNRTDVNTDVQIRLTAELDFDDTSLGSGDTIYINSTLATWDSVNLRFYILENYATALNYTYELTSITETGYTITEVTNTSYVWQIWDQFVLTRFNSTDADGRTNLDVTEYIHFGMKWDYDDEVFQSGNGTVYVNSTLMTWNTSQNCWSTSWVNSTSVSYLFAYASHTDSVYGITVIDWGAYDNVTQSWDRIDVTVVTNMTWTVVGYNVMISYTSAYESDGVTWSGNATVANTSMVVTSRPRNENLTFSTVVNKTFYATAISADPNGVTGFTTTTVWCVFDNITAAAMYGVEITEGSKTFTISFLELQWQYNSSGIGADWVCDHIRNGTVVSSATTGGDDLLSPLEQEIPIDPDWDVVLYSNNATKTIGSRSYDFQWYSITQIIVATQDITEEITTILDTTIVISGKTNVDFTWTVYNDTAATGETGTVSDADDWRITFNMIMTYGNHSYGIYCDAGDSGNRWINSTYFIDFDVNIDPPKTKGVSMQVLGTINIACSYYIYHEGVYSDESGSLTPTMISFLFTKKTTAGLHNYSIYFNISATVGIWKPGSYYVDPTWDDCKVTLYNSEGTGLEVDDFIVYVNGTRYYDNEFYGRTDYDYNITVTDYFGYTIHSVTCAYDRHIDVGIAFYVYKVQSELQGQAVYFNLTRAGGAKFSQHILSGEIVSYYLVAGEYTYEFRKISTVAVVGGAYIYYEGTFTLSCDKTHIIDGTNLRDLEGSIELIPVGKADTKDLDTAMTGIIDMISMMQIGMWGLAFLIVGGMAATATEEVITKDGKKIKKRKIPEQLKRFAFPRGAKNPKSKKIPKGAGRSSWKGVPFRDEMTDWRDKK